MFIASPAELKLLDGKMFCATCAARPDVNYLETFRLKYWGKRDGWAWFIGFGSLVNLINGAQLASSGQGALAIVNLVSAVLGVCFFFGFPWARFALLGTIGISAAVAFATTPSEMRGVVVMTFLIPLLIAIAIFNDTRNQLFFKVEIPRAKLQKAWNLYMNNTVARAGFMLALVGVLMPPFAVLGLIASIIGLRNVNPHSTPPIGRKGQAIAGIVISAVSIMVWVFMMLWYVLATAAW